MPLTLRMENYVTIYSGNNSWKKGHKIHTFFIDGIPYLRIDKNKAILDYLGDLLESSFVKSLQIQELESKPEPEEEPLLNNFLKSRN